MVTEDGLTEFDKMGMNELRARLYEMGVDYPDKASREELIQLIKANS